MLEIPKYVRYDKSNYIRYYYLILFKKLKYFYGELNAFKLISKRLTKGNFKTFIEKTMKYMEIENDLDTIINIMKKNHKYEKKILNFKTFTITEELKIKRKEEKYNKVKETNLKKYGHEFPFQSNEIQEKVRETVKTKYNVDNIFQTKEVIEKIKQTKLEKYGDPNYCNTEKIKESLSNLDYNEIISITKQTKLERYGDENYVNVKKCKQTKLERYGDPNYNNIEKIKINTDYEKKHKKFKENFLKNYGVVNPFCLEEVKEKIKKTNLEKFGFEHPMQNLEFKEKVLEKTIPSIRKHIKNFEELKSEEFWRSQTDELNRVSKQKMKKYFNIGDDTYTRYKPKDIISKKQYGYLEGQFLNDIEEQFNINLKRQYKIENYHVDGFDEKTDTIFEFLGDYWHGRSNNDEVNKNNKKTFKELYNKTFERFEFLYNLDYHIMFIWESDYLDSGLHLLQYYEP